MPRPRQRRALLHLGVALSSLAACGPAQPLAETSTSAQTTSSSSTTGTTTTTPTTSAAPTTTTTTDSGTTTPGMDFIVKPDGTYPSEQCSTFAQDCPAGQKCMLWAEDGGGAWNATKCVQVTGDRAPGESCTAEGYGVSGIDDCEAGAICWGVDVMGTGTCLAYCMGSENAPTCPPGYSCEQARIIALCYANCDPLVQICKQPGEICLPDEFSPISYCFPDKSPIEGVANDPCKNYDDCEPGFYCLESAAASKACPQDFFQCCQPFCEYPGGPCPNPDQQCRQFYDPELIALPPGAEKLGICAIPT